MSERRRLHIAPAIDSGQTTVLADADLTALELGALVTMLREAMMDSFKHGPYAMFREMREHYIEARSLFLRKFLR